MKRILCVGNACVDVTVKPVDRLPETGTLQFVDSITTSVGGCAANAAMVLAKLGADVRVCTAVGDDGFGDYILSAFRKFGLATDDVRRFDGLSTAASIVQVCSTGERSFLHDPGVTSVYAPGDVSEKTLCESDIVFLTGAMIMRGFDGGPAAELLERAKELGKYTVMDTCWDSDGVWMKKVCSALPHLDMFMPSIEEAEMLAETANPDAICDAFLSKGVQNIIIKMGSKGAYVCEGNSDKRYISPSFKRERIIDTNGAGDAFCAGFLCGLSRGMDIQSCARYANAVGSFCVTGAGSCAGIPSMSVVDHFLENN